MMTYVAAGLGVLVLMLSYACRRLWLATQDTGRREWVFSIDQQLREACQLVREQSDVISQVGELFDHLGVDLECSGNKQASEDLKRLGLILRSRHHHPESEIYLGWAQDTLSELGERYGIEPISGVYSMRSLVRIAEEIVETVLDQRVAALYVHSTDSIKESE